MNRDEFAASIDHTVLGPETTWSDVRTVLAEAADHGMNACIPPCYVAEAADADDAPSTVATVVGFPHGQHAAKAKRDEAVGAWEHGADEIDLVINVGRLKAGEDDAVAAEISDVVAAVPIPVKVIVETALLTDEEKRRACAAAVAAEISDVVAAVPIPVKVIVETALLTDEEKRRACAVAVDADADMVKTSTGFADGGAALSDVELMSEYLPVKASGGVGSYEEAAAMLEAGAERIGASSGVAIVEGYPE